MDRKSSILMSVLGVFALVIVTVGVSYAFFSYTRTGAKTNTIQSGKISFYYTEVNQITLTNAMPVDDSAATGTTVTDTKNVGEFEFKVGAVDLSGVEIGYDVILVDANSAADVAAGKVLDANQVSLLLLDTANSGNGTITNKLSTPKTADVVLASQTGTKNAVIAQGVIKAGSNAAGDMTVNDTYTLRMWLSNTNSNLDINASDNGSGVISSGPNYVVGSDGATVSGASNGKSYSVKVKVETTSVVTTN